MLLTGYGRGRHLEKKEVVVETNDLGTLVRVPALPMFKPDSSWTVIKNTKTYVFFKPNPGVSINGRFYWDE